MGHVVDEVVLHIVELLLTEDGDDDEDEQQQHDEREDERGHHERHTRIDEVAVAGGEEKFHIRDAFRKVVGKEHLHVGACQLGILGVVALGTIDVGAVAVDDGKLILERQAHMLKLAAEHGVELLHIDTLQDGFVRGLGQDAEHHVVQHFLLIHILPHEHLLHGALTVLNRVVAVGGRQGEGMGRDAV